MLAKGKSGTSLHIREYDFTSNFEQHILFDSFQLYELSPLRGSAFLKIVVSSNKSHGICRTEMGF